MPALPNVPPELLLHVLQFLSTADLASLSKTSSLLHTTTESFLYRSISWTFDQEETYQRPSICLFLRSLLEQPSLASHVRKIHFHSDSSWYNSDDPYKIRLSKDDRRLIWRTMKQTHFEHCTELKRALRDGSLDAVTAFLLSRLHNLEILEIGYGLIRTSSLLGLMLTYVVSGPGQEDENVSSFRRLRDVRYSADKDYESLNRASYHSSQHSFKQVTSLFYIPSLETIDIVLPEPKQGFVWPYPDPCLLNLITLRLRHSEASISTLEKILNATPILSTVQYDFVQNVDKIDQSYVNGSWNEWGQLTEVLRM
ncbi:MAG: hypothetical protein Q9164_007469, partial [Protoblastenia rupestris]